MLATRSFEKAKLNRYIPDKFKNTAASATLKTLATEHDTEWNGQGSVFDSTSPSSVAGCAVYISRSPSFNIKMSGQTDGTPPE